MIDLHVHSTCSDGTLTPTQLVTEALNAGLSVIALTDHDTVAGIDEIMKAAADTSLMVIPGIELSALAEGREIHILGYHIDWHNGELLQRLEEAHRIRVERNVRMIQMLHDYGFDIDEEQIARRFPDTVVTRMHFARFLMEKGYIQTPQEAFQMYIGPGCPCYLEKREMAPERAIETIHLAGGTAVLAHPNLYKKNEEQQEVLLAQLKDYGLDGIETIYSMNTPEQEAMTRRLAKKFDLFMTGGSDFHGSNKPHIKIGVGQGNLNIPDEFLKNIIIR